MGDALRAGIAIGSPEIPIKINLIAPPVYVMTCSTPERADGLTMLNDACKAVEEKIKSGWAETRTSTAIATRTMMRTEAEMMKTTEVMDRYCCDLHSPVSGYLLLYPIYFKKNLHLDCLNLNN